MKLSGRLVVGCIGSCALFTALLAPDDAAAMFLGMLAPLIVGVVTVIMVERTTRTDIGQLTARMTVAFVAKVLFYGGYVGVVVGLLDVEPVPFVASFTGYFVVLLFTEALYFKTLFDRTSQKVAGH
jgi:hypothetical protein